MIQIVGNSHLEKANQLRREGKLEEAVAEYRRGVELMPDLSWSHYYLGEALAQLGDWDGAIEAYRQAIAINSSCTLSHHKLGWALVETERWGEAVEVLTAGIELKPDYYKYYPLLGRALAQKQDWQGATEAYRQAVELRPEDAECNWQLGELLRRRGAFREALIYLQRAADLQGDDPQLQFGLGVALVEAGTDLDRAEACLRRSLEGNPNSAEAYFYLGKVEARRGHPSEAVGLYRRSLEMNPRDADCGLALAAALEKLGRPAEAVEQYRRVLLESEESGAAVFGLGRALAELQRWVEAVVEYRRALKLGFETPEVHRRLAEALVELRRWPEVVVEWKSFLEGYPGAATVRRRLALALIGLGRWREAAAEWRQYWQVPPGSGSGRVAEFRRELQAGGEIPHCEALSLRGDLTVEFWLYLREWPAVWTDIIAKFVSDELNEFCFRLKDGERGQWYFGTGEGFAKPVDWVPQEDMRLNEWVHVACVRKVGQYGRVYFDGVLRREGDWSGETGAGGTEAPVRLMASSDGKRFNDGKLCEVRIWNVARSEDEIRGGMYESLAGEEPGLVGVWNLDESPERVLVDAVGDRHGRVMMAEDAGKARPRVGVCGWELSHNAAGRAYTLAQLYRGFAEVELLGCLFPRYGGQVWEPIRGAEIPCHAVTVADEGRFVEQALGLVLAHPYEVVHLSKPRIPNIVLGLLYKLVWGARVIVDIDDEELAFVKAEGAVDLREFLESGEQLPQWGGLDGRKWTQIAVGLAREFDGVTVSNPALQERYGGVVIRHARDEGQFVPSEERRRRSRERLGIARDKKVVLFFGTPKEHKGLVATAEALAGLGRGDVVFAIVGDFTDAGLKERLLGISGVEYVFIGNQPFDEIPDVVAAGDICVLLQDSGSPVSQFQTPAKLSDALGMGLVVLLSESAAVADVIESGAVVPVAEGNLAGVLGRLLSEPAEMKRLGALGRELLAAEFGFEVNISRLAGVLDEVRDSVGVLSEGFDLLWAGFPAVGSVLSEGGTNQVLAKVGRGISVIILSLNGAGLLQRLLSTFFATNTYFPVELIIIDHGSEDNTAEVVGKQAIKGDVRYVNRGENFSFSDSCNYGAGLAKYPYLLFLNNDIVFTSDVLPLAVSRLDDATIGAVGVRLDDEPSSLPKGKEAGVQHTGIEFVWNEKRGYFQPEQIRHGSLKDYLAASPTEGDFFPAVTGAFLLCRKGDFEKVGGFSLDYDYGLEDIDFCLRLGRDLQKRCYCINEVSLQHREGATRSQKQSSRLLLNREKNHKKLKQIWNNHIIHNFIEKDLQYYEEQIDFSTIITNTEVKILSYYLPQFHVIPENDLWHGEGFTEWTKVKQSSPVFEGHYQQHIPHSDIGYYLLDSPDMLRRQADMMKKSGVYGQVFYHYWFSGKLILEKPAKMLYNTPDIEMRYCFCWANENWTRTWDGNEKDILLKQEYSLNDATDFIKYLIPFFKDKRYICIEGRPVIFIYRPSSIPRPHDYIDTWEIECKKHNIKKPYVVAVLTRGATNPFEYNMDAGVERVLHDWTDKQVPEINNSLNFYEKFSGSILSYKDIAEHYVNQEEHQVFPYFRSIVPCWDNTPRHGSKAYITHGSNPALFQVWLESLIAQSSNKTQQNEKIIVINAWNEWAEGAHLEPDSRYGYAYLNSIGRVLSGIPYSNINNCNNVLGISCKLHISIAPNIIKLLKLHPNLKHKFIHSLFSSSVFKTCSVSINTSLFQPEDQSLLSVIEDDASEADYIVRFQKLTLIFDDTLEKMLSTAFCNPASAIVSNPYDREVTLINVDNNGNIDESSAHQSPILLIPSCGFTNFKMRTDVISIVIDEEYLKYYYSSEKPLVTTIIRFHKSASFQELNIALNCLYSMIGCTVIPLVAAQDLSAEQIEKLKKLMSKFKWNRGYEIVIYFDTSPDSNNDLRSKMLNNSLKQVNTKYVAFLDYDDRLMSHAYAYLLERIKKTQKAISFGRVYKTTLNTATLVMSNRQRHFEYGYSYDDFVNHNHAPIHSFLIDIDKIGFDSVSYNPYQKYMEDYYLTLQLFTRNNADWDSLKENFYIGDYIYCIDKQQTLAIKNEEERHQILADQEYIVCEESIRALREHLRSSVC